MQLPPGPVSLLEFLNMLIQRKRHPIRLYEEVFRKYGDIVYFQLGPYKFAMLNDAEAIEQVLHSESKNYTKSTGYQRFKLIVGNGLLVSEGDVWKRQRRLLSWAFSSKHIERIFPTMVRETQEMLKRWKSKQEIDLAEEMNLVTLQVISKSLFGRNQMASSKDVRNSLQVMLKYLQTTRHLWIQLLLAPFPLKDKRSEALKIEASLPFKSTKSFFGSIKTIDKLVHSMIEERKKDRKSENFLDAMIEATDSEDQSQMTNQQLRDEVVNMLIAGHETTANALTWTWHQLIKNPKVFKRVRAEINSVVTGDTPKFDDLSKLPYTNAVFEESMRLYPPFWRISRRNINATKIKGYDIPEGTNIIASIYTLHRREKYWKNPTEFNPERFLNRNKSENRFTFIPFGAGPRACIGAQFATIEALTILAITIKNYDFEALYQGDPEYFMSLTLQPRDGCKVKLLKAKKE
jgi:cytochrome P450